MKHMKTISMFLLSISILICLAGCTSPNNLKNGSTIKPEEIGKGLPQVEVDDAIVELTRLEQTHLAYLAHPGWLHTQQWRWNASLEGQQEDGNAPNNTAGIFPPIQVCDSWLQIIDDDGNFGLGNFSVTSDEDGNPVQVAVSDPEGNGGNLTLLKQGLTAFFENDSIAEANLENPVKIASSIRDIIEGLKQVQGLDTVVRADYVLQDGSEEYQIVIQTAVVDEPYEFDWISEPVEGFITIYRINSSTGVVLEMTSYDIGLSGEVYEDFSQLTLVQEVVDAMPEDIQEQYKSALNDYLALLEEKEGE